MTVKTLSEYNTPEIYEAEYGQWKGDLPLFTGLIKSGQALDLACGTGRVTIPLAQSGLSCLGLDGSGDMLSLAREKSHGLDITYVEGDMRCFKFDKNFDLITMAGNSFQALLNDEDQIQLLTCVKDHLKVGGIFAFDTRTPQPEELLSTEDFDYWHSFRDLSGHTVRVYGQQHFDSLTNIVTYKTKRVWPDYETMTEIKLRFTDPETLKNKLISHGFEIINCYGDYEKTPFSPACKRIILICKRS